MQTKVTVIITTYNHERFIKQAIDSVIMQETNFDYNLVIIEDCSTDRTQDIVTAYQKANPEKIRLVLSSINKCDNSEFIKAIQESQCTYLAILDGDDYWTCRHKLQKQVDYLDRRPDCTICFHDVKIVNDNGDQELRNSYPPDRREIFTLEDLIEGCFINTCSAVLRQSAFREFPEWYIHDQSADWSLFIFAAQKGQIGHIDGVMGVYRRHAGGSWAGLNRAEQLERIIVFYEILRSYLPGRYSGRIETELARQCHDLAFEHARMGNRVAARNYLNRSKWLLRSATGNKAHLMFPPDYPERTRIVFEKIATKNAFDIQLNRPCLGVEKGKAYRVVFRGRADGRRRIFLGFARAYEPWTGLGLYERIELTAEWQNFESTFVAVDDEENGRIHFDVGESDVPVELSDIRLHDVLEGKLIEPDVPSIVTIEARRATLRATGLDEDARTK